MNNAKKYEDLLCLGKEVLKNIAVSIINFCKNVKIKSASTLDYPTFIKKLKCMFLY